MGDRDMTADTGECYGRCWLCSGNDVLGNLAVLLAALGVFRTGSGWPDVSIAVIMGGLVLQGSLVVIRQAMTELKKEICE